MLTERQQNLHILGLVNSYRGKSLPFLTAHIITDENELLINPEKPGFL